MGCAYIKYALSKWYDAFWGKPNNKTVQTEAQSGQYHTTWSGVLHMVSKLTPNLRWGNVYKPMGVTSENAGFQEWVIVTSHIAWV